ncbi:hypothetical protein CsSME_00011499 [Camellia sinensis var. sinensis]
MEERRDEMEMVKISLFFFLLFSKNILKFSRMPSMVGRSSAHVSRSSSGGPHV